MKTDRTQKGQALILIVFGVIALIAITGLAVDSGSAYYNRRGAQNAADTAALTGALDIVNSKSGSATTDETNAATASGFKDDGGVTTTVTVNPAGTFVAGCNGTTPSFTTNSTQYVQVIIQTTVKTTFASLIGRNQTHNCVDAIARGNPGQVGGMFSGDGIVALSKTACPAIYFSSTTANVQGGGIFDNSSCSDAFDGNWGNNLTTSGGCIGVVGGLGNNFTPARIAQGAETIIGPGICAVPPQQIDVPDFSTLVPALTTPPTCSAPGVSSYNSSTGVLTITSPGSFSSLSFGYAQNQNMPSGTYCITGSGGFSVTGGATVTGGDVVIVFGPGSGGASIAGSTKMTFSSLQIYTQNATWANAGSTTLSVSGVFRFYATGTANYTVGGSSNEQLPNGFLYLTGGTFQADGSNTFTLDAPTSGPYQNVAIFSPVTNTSTTTVYGGSNYTIIGTILLPGENLYLQGSAGMKAWNSQIVCNTLNTNGGDVINVNYSPSQNIGVTTAATVELIK